MATLTTSNFAGYLQRFTAAVQASASVALDFAVGSVVRALGEAIAGVALWLQFLVLQLIALTRAATSSGSDVDSWMADFQFPRFGGAASNGTLTPFRANTSIKAVVPVGWTVSTVDGSVSVAVTKDTTNPNWNDASNGYVLAAGTGTITVPATATTEGADTNVLASTLTAIQTPIIGVDSVSNAAAFADGLDGWTDDEYRAAFVLYLQSLRTSNFGAVSYAVSTTPGVVRFKIIENLTWVTLTSQTGEFFVLADDGTANPPAQLYTDIDAAVTTTKGAGIEYAGSHQPTGITTNINMTVVLAANADPSVELPAIQKRIKNYVGSFPLGGGVLALAKLAQLAYAASSFVTNVVLSSITINSVNADLVITTVQVPLPGTVTVTT